MSAQSRTNLLNLFSDIKAKGPALASSMFDEQLQADIEVYEFAVSNGSTMPALPFGVLGEIVNQGQVKEARCRLRIGPHFFEEGGVQWPQLCRKAKDITEHIAFGTVCTKVVPVAFDISSLSQVNLWEATVTPLDSNHGLLTEVRATTKVTLSEDRWSELLGEYVEFTKELIQTDTAPEMQEFFGGASSEKRATSKIYYQTIKNGWFIKVTETYGKNPTTLGAPTKNRQTSFLTPDIRDMLRSERAAMPSPKPVMGTLHPNQTKFNGYRLCAIIPMDTEDLMFEFLYANSRQDQEVYNAQHADGEDWLVRNYVIPRVDHFNAGTGFSVRPSFSRVVATTVDPQFPEYKFTHEKYIPAPKELEGYFVQIQQYFQETVKVERGWDPTLEADVTKTTEIVPKGQAMVASVPGTLVEYVPVNTFYKLKITTSAGLGLPTQLATLPRDVNRNFPPLLKSVKLVAEWALAMSTGAPRAYKDAYMFDYEMVNAAEGPFEARELRFITNDPESYLALYPIPKIVAAIDTVGVVRSWYYASTDGNSAFAEADQIQFPQSVHGEIMIENADTYSVGQNKTRLPASPGFASFASLGVMNAGFEVREGPLGLKIVSVIQINTGNLYTGGSSSFGAAGVSTGAGAAVVVLDPPELKSANVNADNTVISGLATAGAQITAVYQGQVVGRGRAEVNEAYTMELTEYFGDPVEVSITARKNGNTSSPYKLVMRDLVPLTPVASFNGTLDEVAGVAQRNATVVIEHDPMVKQRIEVEVTGTVTVDSFVSFQLYSAYTSVSPITVSAPVLNGDTNLQVAAKVRDMANGNGQMVSNYTITVVSGKIRIEDKFFREHDSILRALIYVINPNGIDDTASDDDTTGDIVGRGKVEVTAGADGSFLYAFPQPLVNGDVVHLYARDNAGTSGYLTLEASLDPPVITAAQFPTDVYDTIVGTVDVISGFPISVGLYQGNTLLDTESASDIDGTFEFTFASNKIRGEEYTLRAFLDASPNVVSAAVDLVAYDLNLPIPNYTAFGGGYTGTYPADATDVVYRRQPSIDDPTPDEFSATLFPTTQQWKLTLPSEKAGQIWQVFFRFAVGDGDFNVIVQPNVPLSAPTLSWSVQAPAEDATGTPQDKGRKFVHNPRNQMAVHNPANALQQIWIDISQANVEGPFNGCCLCSASTHQFFLEIQDPEPGYEITLSFPVSDNAPVVVNPATKYKKWNQNTDVYRLFPFAAPNINTAVSLCSAGNFVNSAQDLREFYPIVMDVTMTTPDGRAVTVRYDRDGSAPFNNTHWRLIPFP